MLMARDLFGLNRPSLAYDMNADGVVTISDVGLWLKWLYFWPGDTAVQVIGPTAVGKFLKFSDSSFGGRGSGILSAVVWGVVIGVIGIMQEPSRPKVAASYPMPSHPAPRSQDPQGMTTTKQIRWHQRCTPS
jgi:hypothetical protein